MFIRIVTAAALLLLTTTTPVLAYLLIDHLNPVGGALTGAPGATIGWAFTVTNNNTVANEWLFLTASDFTPPTSLGLYTDYVVMNGILLSPGQQVTQVFDSFLQTGAGSFTIDSLATPGSTASGNLVFTYDTYDGDPTGGGTQTGFSVTAETSASIIVQIHTAVVPEPSTCVLLSIALGVVGFTRRKLRM